MEPEREDELCVREPVVRGEPTKEDAELAEDWYDKRVSVLAERYPNQFLLITRDGVVALGIKEYVTEQGKKLQIQYGRFWGMIGCPSMDESGTPLFDR